MSNQFKQGFVKQAARYGIPIYKAEQLLKIANFGAMNLNSKGLDVANNTMAGPTASAMHNLSQPPAAPGGGSMMDNFMSLVSGGGAKALKPPQAEAPMSPAATGTPEMKSFGDQHGLANYTRNPEMAMPTSSQDYGVPTWLSQGPKSIEPQQPSPMLQRPLGFSQPGANRDQIGSIAAAQQPAQAMPMSGPVKPTTPPQAPAAQPVQQDFASAFRKAHGGAFDPHSAMDRWKMQKLQGGNSMVGNHDFKQQLGRIG
jgi:hypothetical protein